MREVAEVRTIDGQAWVPVPADFAGAKVVVEQVDGAEVRVRKAEPPDAADLLLPGEPLQPLSDRDRDLLLDLIENPPPPNAALLRAAAEYRTRHA